MRHGMKLTRLGRASGPRRLLLRSLATELIKHERITTTVARAKALKGPADKVFPVFLEIGFGFASFSLALIK